MFSTLLRVIAGSYRNGLKRQTLTTTRAHPEESPGYMLRQTSRRKVAPTFSVKYLLDRVFPKQHEFQDPGRSQNVSSGLCLLIPPKISPCRVAAELLGGHPVLAAMPNYVDTITLRGGIVEIRASGAKSAELLKRAAESLRGRNDVVSPHCSQ